MAFFQVNFFSSSLCFNTDINVFIPTPNSDELLNNKDVSYFKKGPKYPVLYLFHGAYGDYSDWIRLTSIEKYAQERKLAIVMPSASNSFYQNMYRRSDYLTYLTSELPCFIEENFPISNSRSDNFTAGLSMGGYGAFNIALKVPQKFKMAFSISGTLDILKLKKKQVPHMEKIPKNYFKAVFGTDINNDNHIDLFQYLENNGNSQTIMPKLYMCCGEEDFMFPLNNKFYTFAKNLDLDIEYEVQHGTHDWDYSIKRIVTQIIP